LHQFRFAERIGLDVGTQIVGHRMFLPGEDRASQPGEGGP
jgi:hypothetical protein